MKSAQEFLTEFAKDIIHNPMDRPVLIAGWAKHMEARERQIRIDCETDLSNILNPTDTSSGSTPLEDLMAAKKAAGLE